MNMFLTSLVSAWGGALLSFLWQGLLIGIVAAFLLGQQQFWTPKIYAFETKMGQVHLIIKMPNHSAVLISVKTAN